MPELQPAINCRQYIEEAELTMAHPCPECGAACHCGGDVDDVILRDDDAEFNCTHCEDDWDMDEDEQ